MVRLESEGAVPGSLDVAEVSSATASISNDVMPSSREVEPSSALVVPASLEDAVSSEASDGKSSTLLLLPLLQARENRHSRVKKGFEQGLNIVSSDQRHLNNRGKRREGQSMDL
jgi:hypothetical protein